MATIYGTHVVKLGEYEWRIHVKLVRDGICNGIIPNDNKILKKWVDGIDYDMIDGGYWWYPTGSMSGQLRMEIYLQSNLKQIISMK